MPNGQELNPASPLSAEMDQRRREHTAPGPERSFASPETMRRLPVTVRRWYQARIRNGGWPPTELGAQCLVNDFLAAKYRVGGIKGVDGWKVQHSAA